MNPEACVVVFAKEPIAGQVKTRLIPALGAEAAKDIHLQLMKKIFTTIGKLALCPAQLWVNNNPSHSAFSVFDGEHKLQVGADLGDKMLHAAESVLEEFKHVIIIGSDCPQMDEAYLKQALQALTENDDVDVVLGPASDGGYVLVGMNRAIPEVFEGVTWGSDKVLEQTRDQLQRNNICWKELPELFDIDRPEDLKLL